MNFLKEIISEKRIEIERAKRKLPLVELRRSVQHVYPKNNFMNAVRRREGEPLKIIAEIKRASPSKGTIAKDINLLELAEDYTLGGASAISILTESRFFNGSASDLQNVHDAVPGIPLLRKDFIIDEYQIYESVHFGADAILLIVAALTAGELKDFVLAAKDMRLSSLVEVHCEQELEAALSAGAEIIGVNNRNLTTFEVSQTVSEQLGKRIPGGTISVSESGIKDDFGLRSALESGYHAVLIGEHFMRAKDRLAEVRKFSSSHRAIRY